MGVLFPFFPVSGNLTFPLWWIVAQQFYLPIPHRTFRFIPSYPTDLCTFRFLGWFWTWSSHTLDMYLFFSVTSFAFCDLGGMSGQFATGDWCKKVVEYFNLLYILALLCPSSEDSHFPHSFFHWWHTRSFSCSPWHPWLDFCQGCHFSQTWSFAAQTISLYSFQATCPCFHSVSFCISVCLGAPCSSLQASDLLFVGMHHS